MKKTFSQFHSILTSFLRGSKYDLTFYFPGMCAIERLLIFNWNH